MARKNLIKLIPQINMFNLHPTANCPEYKFLDKILTDKDVDALLHIKVRTSYYRSEIAKKFKLSEAETTEMIDRLTDVGVLEYKWDSQGKEMIYMPLLAPGSFENFFMKKEQSEAHPEGAQAFPDYVNGLMEKYAHLFPTGMGLAHAIPVQKAIEAEPQHVEIEELSYWVEKYAPKLSVATCQCRRARRIIGEGTGDPEDEWCIQLGEYSDSCVKTGRARRITKEECYDILYRAEELGYVHTVTNLEGCGTSLFICNCCWDTCIALRKSWWTNTPNIYRSNFVASVNTEKCMACGQCQEVCPQNAVKLGEKLCQKHPKEYKWRPIPQGEVVRHKEYWRTDLLHNRENVWSETGTSPCKTECPAHVPVQAYLRLAGEGRYEDALELIKKENPFPAVCGRVCNRRCELACTRGELDQAVAIDEVKKFIAEQDLNKENRLVPKKLYPNQGKKIAVIGSGPSGLSCAYYLAVYGHQVTVFEKQDKLGGMMTMGIPSFRLEKDVVNAEIDILKQLGVEFKTSFEVGKDATIPQLREQGFKGFYIGIGLQGGGNLGIPGADAEGVMPGIDLMRKVNGGEDVKLSGKVVVIGGGNIGADVARTAIRCGAESVDMYCLESYEEMPMGVEDRTECEEDGILIHAGWGQTEIITGKNGNCSGINFHKCLSVKNSAGKFDPKFDDSVTEKVDCSMVLFCIGQKPEWGNLLEGINIELKPNKLAVANSLTYATAESDVFIGGDIYTGQKFCIDAIAAGKQGAISLNRAVREGHSLVLGRDRRNYKSIDKEDIAIDPSKLSLVGRQVPAKNPENKLTFKDERCVFTPEQIKAETDRCLGCGAAHVDENQCIGCGLCTTRCKFDAITLRKIANDSCVSYEELPKQVAKHLLSSGAKIVTKDVMEMVSLIKK